MQTQANAGQKPEFIRLEIATGKVLALISAGHLHVEDLRGLDLAAKRSIWRHCLSLVGGK